MPVWLSVVSVISLVLAGVCAVVIAIDLLTGHRQPMAIMNLVWPITALYGGPLALWAYMRIGRSGSRGSMANMQHGAPGKDSMSGMPPQFSAMPLAKMPSMWRPKWQSVAVATTHCGSGCTVGDMIAETFLYFVPLTLFGKPIFAAWVVDYILAFIFGIAFQYLTIKPMKNLTSAQALLTAIKIDSLSLTAWQVGMYGWMASIIFGIVGHDLSKTDPVFWFMMQIAMCAGFLTSYPVTWWLVSRGIKEAM
ncbi:MAG TPA: DUF4396 domain-containing protein [Pirellulales bacterium]|nr:DUF4396 domain-containing protein [Pirellulales bacterium]